MSPDATMIHDRTALRTPPANPSGLSPFPAQSFRTFDTATRRNAPLDWSAPVRRTLVFGGTAALTIWLTIELFRVLQVGGWAELEIVLMFLFVLNIAWLSLSFMTGLAGFITLALGLPASYVRPITNPASRRLTSRNAVLVCTYNEAPERIFGMAMATMQQLAATGKGEAFDMFILSDTTDPDVWVQEEAAFQLLLDRQIAAPRIHYRRRSNNSGKKAGNVADWCRQWGSAYDHMIVLDADSLMTADTLITLSAALEDDADLGLVQSVPTAMGRSTLFARLQQFACAVYGPVMATGLSFWHRGEGNFWGHNAIIRVKAFMESAGLPTLPGKAPFGGPILSHDFVEAALMVRRGWKVAMVPAMAGSYEESPPGLLDFAVRDRRWCQGNLQHARIVLAKGLHPVSRLHFTMGIMAYVSALLWFLFLVTALWLTIQERTAEIVYFEEGTGALFPTFPKQDPERALTLLALTLTLLLVPKVFGWLLVMFDGTKRRAMGGALAVTAGVLAETLLSSLYAHIMMILQTVGILDILRGKDSGWNPQRRDDGSLPTAMIYRHHLRHTLLGIVLAAITLSTSFVLFLWMLPAVIGLTFAGPLSALSASRDWGLAAKRIGLFLTPEETETPAIALEARSCGAALSREISRNEAIAYLLQEPELMRLHRELIEQQPPTRDAMIGPNLAIGRAKLQVSGDIDELVNLLKPGEKAALLADPESVARIAAMIMRRQEVPRATSPAAA